MPTLAQVFAEAKQPPDMAKIGPPAWAELHAWADRFAAKVGASCGCGVFARDATRALHDLVSVKLGKKAVFPETLREVAKMYQEAAQGLRANGVSEAVMATPPPFGWPGGKKVLKHRIIALIPPHKTYVEPFAGAASVFWAKEPAEIEVLNDLDSDLMRFYQNIGDIQHCDIQKLAQDWEGLRAKRGQLEPCEFLAAVDCSFGSQRDSRAGLDTAAGRSCFHEAPHFHKALPEYQTRLAQTKLHQGDWEPVVKQYDAPDTFFYLDPPFHGTSRRYHGGGDQDQLDRLAKVLPTLKGKWLLSYDDHPEVRAAFQGSHIRKVQSYYTIAAGDNNRVAKELLIANYALRGTTMEQIPPVRFDAIREGARKVLAEIRPLLERLKSDELIMPEGLLLQVIQREAQNINQLSAVLEFSPTLLTASQGVSSPPALLQRLPLCTPAQQQRLERCILALKAKGSKANPWAVCQASLECRRRRWQVPEDSGQWVYAPELRQITQASVYPWPEGMFDEDEEEDDEEDGMEKQPKQSHFSQSFVDTILHTAIGTGVAIGVSKVLNPTPAPPPIIKEEKPKEPTLTVINPAHVEGDQANVDLGTLLEEIDAILKKPETMGIVDAETLTIVRG